MNICDLDIRNIDPVYRDYCPMVKTAPDGAVYVFICEYEGRKRVEACSDSVFDAGEEQRRLWNDSATNRK
jgi:hypothetical protein